MILSDESEQVIAAFVKAAAVMGDVRKNAKVNAGQMRYTYADLATVLEAVRPHLAANGLALSQWADEDGVSTVLYHTSGQWIKYPPLQIAPEGAKAQAVGSAISYAKRYQILSVFGLATEDDDGAHAQQPPVKAAPKLLTNVKRLQIAFSDAGIKGRDERLNYCTEIVGRTIGSSKDLRADEIGQIVEALNANAE